MGCRNIDHRLQQSDFRDDEVAPVLPGSEVAIADFNALRAALLVGANLRKEQPLLALRLRSATRNSGINGGDGAQVSVINPLHYEQNFAVANTVISGAELVAHFAGVAVAVADASGVTLPTVIGEWATVTDTQTGIARDLLAAGNDGVILIGALAQQHPDAAVIRGIAKWLAKQAVAGWRCYRRATGRRRGGRVACRIVSPVVSPPTPE